MTLYLFFSAATIFIVLGVVAGLLALAFVRYQSERSHRRQAQAMRQWVHQQYINRESGDVL